MNSRLLTCICFAMAATASVAHAARKSPTSKLYVADLEGESQINTGSEIDDLTKKSVYNASGTTIDTKPTSNISIVLSNGTGIFVDVDTHLSFSDFQQEPFRPNRSDLDDEPSISRSVTYLHHGVIGVSTSKLVAGSSLIVNTDLMSASIHGRQSVIDAKDNLTVISMITGDATVQAGPLDHPRLLKERQQMFIRPGKPGEPNEVYVQETAPGEEEGLNKWLEDRVETADSARKLVYFESLPNAGGSKGAGTDGSITTFDSDSSSSSPGDTNPSIIAVPVAPTTPTVQPTVSVANLGGA